MTSAVLSTLGCIALVSSAVFAKRAYDYSTTDQKLRSVIQQYLSLIDKISQGIPFGNEPKCILDPNCQKYLNGKRFTDTREAFIDDLLAVYKSKGSWTVQVKKTVCSPDDRTVVLQLNVLLDKKPYTAAVLFHFNSQNLISSIDETFAEASGSYGL